MRKIGMVLAMLVCTMMAQAGEYAYLVFTNTAGTTTALTVSNMTLSVNGSELIVTNSEGTQAFTLTDLAEMQFSTTDTVTALDNVLDGNQAVKVYSISGTSLGTFDNLVQAAQQLGAGVYVIVQNSKSQKLVVK